MMRDQITPKERLTFNDNEYTVSQFVFLISCLAIYVYLILIITN